MSGPAERLRQAATAARVDPAIPAALRDPLAALLDEFTAIGQPIQAGSPAAKALAVADVLLGAEETTPQEGPGNG